MCVSVSHKQFIRPSSGNRRMFHLAFHLKSNADVQTCVCPQRAGRCSTVATYVPTYLENILCVLHPLHCRPLGLLPMPITPSHQLTNMVLKTLAPFLPLALTTWNQTRPLTVSLSTRAPTTRSDLVRARHQRCRAPLPSC
jgi:hypothetical protein